MNTSLGAIPRMLYYNNEWPDRPPAAQVEAHAGMKWFRSNIRLTSRLALTALAIQFLLSFGHFHGSSAQAIPTLLEVNLPGPSDTVCCAATHLDAWDGASHANVTGPVGLRTSSDHEPNGQPANDCAICAVTGLANALVVAAPPYLPGPQAAPLLYLTTDAEFVFVNSARVTFQSRAPPIA
jgi:hypothetical protein